ncbi:LysR family transcriptional regulator [Roseibium sp.]|uniref:LysR family transcriptional regulator n=1 Tax=Roseibium sp. TaxID=1936156 RepID=UPI003A96BA90
MEAGDLSYLAQLRASRTYSAAARVLGVSHTTVARKVRELEAHFQARLVERVADEVVLTAEGERAADAARRIGEEVSLLERSIQDRDTRLAGHIRLTTVDVLAWYYMEAFAGFCADYPEIELTIETDSAVRSLSRREAEVALRLTNAPEDYLYGHEVGRMMFHAYGASGRFSARGDFNQMPWLEYNGPACVARARKWMAQHASEARAVASVSTPLMMLKAVQSGLGAGPLPTALAEQSSGLTRLSDDPCFSLGIWLLAPRELRHTARIRALFDTLSRQNVPEHNFD